MDNPYIRKVWHMKKAKLWIYFALANTLLIIFDQYTKWLATVKLKGKSSYELIEGVFDFTYHENRGAAFSSLQGKGLILAIGTIFVVLFLIYCYSKIPTGKRMVPLRLIFVLLISGAIGNMLDRFIRHYVVDFLNFELINFPIFNVADCYITISVVLFAIYAIFVYKEEEIDFLFHLRKKEAKKDA